MLTGINNTGYEPSRHYMDFHIAGFTYWEGLEVIGDLKTGTELTLKGEPVNPYDSEAVAVYLGNNKIGYVPKTMNSDISKFLHFGHSDLFEVKVSQIDMDEHPERQVRVVVRIKDIR